MVNDKKSSMIPSTRITHLGFVIDSVTMRVSLPEEKVLRIQHACSGMLKVQKVSIRHLASVIGLLVVSSFLAVQYGKLHYCNLEFLKTDGLRQHATYDAYVCLNSSALEDLQWWRDNVSSHNGRSIESILDLGCWQDDLYTDASNSGWGAVLSRQGQSITKCGGRWACHEAESHINFLELKAILLALQSCESLLATSRTVCIHSDNMTAISYLNEYGGCHNVQLNELSRSIWSWYISRSIDITALHIPGIDNVNADALSRNFNDSIE